MAIIFVSQESYKQRGVGIYAMRRNKILPKIQKRDFWIWSKGVLYCNTVQAY